MAPRAAAFLALGLLALVALQGVTAVPSGAADCEICMSDGSNCVSTGTQESKNKNSFIADATSCTEALSKVTCGKCKNGSAKNVDCCTLTCTVTPNGQGSGDILTKCACGPPADNGNAGTAVGICGDPHLQGAYGVQYDFHGLPDKTFNLISDQGLSLNAYFIGQNGLETGVDGTWMSALGLLWTTPEGVRSATFTVKEGAAAFKDAVPFDVEIDKEQVQAASFIAVDQSGASTLYSDDDITVASSPIAYSLKVTVKDHLAMIITAATHEHPDGNHIDIGISNLNVTDTVHGALGQTFAAARAAALKEATSVVGVVPKFDASDIVEGKDVDYMTSSLQSTDFVFNRFNPYGATAHKANVINRKILGTSAEKLVEELVQGELSCQAKATGGLRCYTV